ncbi:MAG: metallopeptidase [Planctomycetia bacterium]|nr:metallopeptidase [Planctomycetia bacterium]MBL6914638.1 metallopeptidase [Planctomycetota bacterium]HCW44740.1 metallopeptidase [Planctomycetota bacterium]
MSILMLVLAMNLSSEPGTHEVHLVHGWNIRVEKKLLEEHPQLAQKALELASIQLGDLAWVLPPRRVEELRQVEIVLDFDRPGLKNLQYHPSRGWLKNNGHAENLALCVHIPQAQSYVNLKRSNTQPWVMLHELAHAWHHQYLGFDHSEIESAYSKAVEAGKYEKVMHINGHMTRHYALTNAKEYFAEGCESYFGTNDFYPFVKPQLKEHDPLLFGIIEKLWNGPVQTPQEGLRDQ